MTVSAPQRSAHFSFSTSASVPEETGEAPMFALIFVREARPIVLEPVVELEITAADGQAGDISGDLSARRGQVSGTTPLPGGQLVVRAQAPLAELSGYQSRLNTLTGGQGRYTMAFSHYDAVPPTVQSKLVAQHQVRDDE